MRRRLRSLTVAELINVPLQAFVWFGLLDFPATVASVAGFAAFTLLIVEGGAYWAAKLRQVGTRRSDLPGLGVFRAARRANVPLLAVALAIGGYAVVTEPGRGSWLGLGFALVAVLEHVNYFHVQLMHDTRADLRRLWSSGLHRSHLARDLSGERLRPVDLEVRRPTA